MDGNGNLGLNYYAGGKVVIANGGGNVGIGTSNPSSKLDVHGNLTVTGITVLDNTTSVVGKFNLAHPSPGEAGVATFDGGGQPGTNGLGHGAIAFKPTGGGGTKLMAEYGQSGWRDIEEEGSGW
jgi:hypothetical protein